MQQVLRKEKEILSSQLKIAKKQGIKEDVRKLEAKLKDLRSFSPNIEVRMIDRSEVNGSSSFEDLYTEFNRKFDSQKYELGKK